MTVLILGGSGFIGAPLVRRLQARGEAVVVAHRGHKAPPPGTEAVLLNRADPGAAVSAARACGASTVIDLIAYAEADTLPLLSALAGEIDRYVLVSSADVYRNYGGLHGREAGEPTPGLLAEDAPLRTSRHPYRRTSPRAADDPERWMDDYDKIPLEAAALAAPGLNAAVVRLPMIYGPGDRNRRFGWLIRPMAEGRPYIILDEAWARWRTSYGFVDNVADGIACAASHPDAAGGTFNVGPTDAPDHLTWAARFAEALDWSGEIRLAAQGEAPMSGALKGLDLRFSLATDTARIRRALGYTEPTPPGEALARTIADELARVRPTYLARLYAAEDAMA